MSEMPASFIITWEAGRYHVSIPNYKGGKVVRADIAERMAEALGNSLALLKAFATPDDQIMQATLDEARSALSAWKDGR